MLGVGTSIPDNTDLNNYTTIGTYSISTNQRATTISNMPPIKEGGVLRVTAGQNSGVVMQFYSSLDKTWQRRINVGGSDGTNWVRIDNFGCNTLAELKAALAAV